MAKQRMMLRFARWHIWLGWLVGVPVLMWTVTGLVMVTRPIDEVRGDALRAPPTALQTGAFTLPDFGEPVSKVELVQQLSGPVWIVTTSDGGHFRYDAASGVVLPPVIESEARKIAKQVYAGDAELQTVSYIPYDEVPLEVRQPINIWQLHYADGTNLYLEAATGQLLAVRTGWWRIYDFMWGLHIMDLQGRENAHGTVIIVFATLAMLGALLGCILMFRRRKARVKA
ncbi:hypothetical protein GRI89_06880 [Altererythrobacter salegens]|uniref:PepSY domain-containing protein n=1 Tax=Croceibacterium salegens TaxID=1737568 RepID=A0A6I4SY75_9SPHN|nr:PepSY domain-containing protein [Croceibacterium salegens]MXO59262.1 hypothetical protein [Croceibacterium salegens]